MVGIVAEGAAHMIAEHPIERHRRHQPIAGFKPHEGLARPPGPGFQRGHQRPCHAAPAPGRGHI